MTTYAPHTQTEAIARARGWVGRSYPVGWCQKWVVAEIFGTGAVGDWDGDGAADAEDGWKKAVRNGKVVTAANIPDINAIPAGLSCYWTGGRGDYGHAAVTAGGGMIYSRNSEQRFAYSDVGRTPTARSIACSSVKPSGQGGVPARLISR